MVGAVVANVLLGDNANDKDNVRELRNEIEFLKDTDPLLFSTSSCLISLESCSSRSKAASAGVNTRVFTGEFFVNTDVTEAEPGDAASTFGNLKNRTLRAPLERFNDFSTDLTMPLIPPVVMPDVTSGQAIHTFLLILTTMSPGWQKDVKVELVTMQQSIIGYSSENKEWKDE